MLYWIYCPPRHCKWLYPLTSRFINFWVIWSALYEKNLRLGPTKFCYMCGLLTPISPKDVLNQVRAIEFKIQGSDLVLPLCCVHGKYGTERLRSWKGFANGLEAHNWRWVPFLGNIYKSLIHTFHVLQIWLCVSYFKSHVILCYEFLLPLHLYFIVYQ